VTSTLAGPSSRRAGASGPAGADRAVTGLDLLALGALLAVALLGWASLALAHLGVHSLPAVLGLTGVGLCLAAVLARGVRVRADVPGVLVALACGAVAAALTVPGFSYGVADKDPGGYVTHALVIGQTGDYAFVDPVLATAAQDPTFPVQLTSPGARFAGVWVRDASTGLIVPQFYHLWPALLATAHDAGGRPALLVTVPLMGVVSVLALCALLRRVGDALLGEAGGLVAAAAGGLLLATSSLQVWQARYPTTEVLAQALYVGALLGIVVALCTGWRPAAGAAGLLVGVGWLNRADGLLLVLLSVGLGAALVATRREDARAAWFTGGLGVVAPHALLQAYDLAASYSAANSIPPLPTVAAVVLTCLAAALVLRVGLARPLARASQALLQRRVQVVAGVLVLAAAGALMVLGYLRPRLFGADTFDYNGREVRSYDEAVMARLTWFVSLPGFALVLAGVAVVVLRRWRAAAWAVVLPTLVLFPLYGYSAMNSTRLMWWTRRYVPTVLPGIVVLIALAVAFLLVWRWRGRLLSAATGAVALVGLLALFLSQSLPLRAHDEFAGSFALSRQVAAVAGDRDGVFLWEADQGCCSGPTRLLAVPVWLQHGQLSALLPNDAALASDANARRTVLDRYAERFAGRPLFVVADAGQLPAGIDPARVEPVLDRQVRLPVWEESDVERPDKAVEVPVHVSVWRVRPF
jgi:hypothetical protein